MKTVTISLPKYQLQGFVEHQVATKDFGNVSEYFRTLLREAQRREEDREVGIVAWLKASASGNGIPLTREFWKEFEPGGHPLAGHRGGNECAHTDAGGRRNRLHGVVGGPRLGEDILHARSLHLSDEPWERGGGGRRGSECRIAEPVAAAIDENARRR